MPRERKKNNLNVPAGSALLKINGGMAPDKKDAVKDKHPAAGTVTPTKIAKVQKAVKIKSTKNGITRPVGNAKYEKTSGTVEQRPDKSIAIEKGPARKSAGSQSLQVTFQLRFHTNFGQELFISGNHPLLGNGEVEKAVPMSYLDDGLWSLSLNLAEKVDTVVPFAYHYILRNADGTFSYDWSKDRVVNPSGNKARELVFSDTWNYAGYFENTFYTEPFVNVLLKNTRAPAGKEKRPRATHTFRVKSPLIAAGQTLCLLGSGSALGNWDTKQPILLGSSEGEHDFTVSIDLANEVFPIAYKYGVYDSDNDRFIRFEDGNNRLIHDTAKVKRHTVLNDGFAVLPNTTWKGAGVAIPVFSLRSEKSFGIGEFTDLALLVDWAKQAGLKMIQLLPVNDTTATHSWTDSYPYAAISAFALHPVYLNLNKITLPGHHSRLQKLEKERVRLNALETVDYVSVVKIKTAYALEVYRNGGKQLLESKGYKAYFAVNNHWLVPYAVFCYLRDQYGTADFNRWPAYKTFRPEDVMALSNEGSKDYDAIAFHYFVQYHLHLQLTEARLYAHTNGIVLKGDIAIGVYRFGADAWQSPDLYHADMQAGAPPDDFAVRGQNWGFPTYNWQRMREDGFSWWKQRLAQMSYYFDAFRIDHILGFFRIWSIPMHAVEGIMGHFVPAIPVHINEFNSNHIWFDHYRYTKPFINEDVLWEIFGNDNELVKSMFLLDDGIGRYALKKEYTTQRLIEKHFDSLELDEHHARIRQGLYDLVSNVILFEAGESDGQHFHFRFNMESTTSFRNLEAGTQQQLKDLYVNYFFRRQDDFWMKEAMQKLPALKRVTNMLVCGEDLGLVPACVPDVMRQLGLLSLEIQRMPKDSRQAFFHPGTAPYLSVVTPSTHDMSTIRGWWEEDRQQSQKFYNDELGQYGEAPFYCEAWINKAIVVQHLYSPAMWCVFQLQDLFGMNEVMRRADPHDERINIPANPKHYWQYRMHVTLESLLQATEFSAELQSYITACGR